MPMLSGTAQVGVHTSSNRRTLFTLSYATTASLCNNKNTRLVVGGEHAHVEGHGAGDGGHAAAEQAAEALLAAGRAGRGTTSELRATGKLPREVLNDSKGQATACRAEHASYAPVHVHATALRSTTFMQKQGQVQSERAIGNRKACSPDDARQRVADALVIPTSERSRRNKTKEVTSQAKQETSTHRMMRVSASPTPL